MKDETKKILKRKTLPFTQTLLTRYFKMRKSLDIKDLVIELDIIYELVINMFYSPGFDVQIETTFSEKCETGGPIADDIFKILGKSLPKGQPINDRNNYLQVV